MNLLTEQMEAAFAKFDKDKTGRINYTEFCTMLNKNNKWNTNPNPPGNGFLGFPVASLITPSMDTTKDYRGSSCVQS